MPAADSATMGASVSQIRNGLLNSLPISANLRELSHCLVAIFPGHRDVPTVPIALSSLTRFYLERQDGDCSGPLYAATWNKLGRAYLARDQLVCGAIS